ncbi:MAG: hypothetical protein RL761_1218, partial [Pseudomonadota bacterium]
DPKLAALYRDVQAMLGCDDRFDSTGESGFVTLKGKPLFLLKGRFINNGQLNDEAAEPIPGFVRVEGGKFSIGHKDEADKDGKSDNPPREFTLDNAPFYMARTLTTVAQFGAFVDDGGYTAPANLGLWDKQGLALLKTEKRNRPHDWDAQQAVGSSPVVNVTWYEARAYARWLQHQLGKSYQVGLPTEAHWERAARHPDVQTRWPWGDSPKTVGLHANTNESDIGGVSSVGCFAPTSIGLLDIAGNVLEWQANASSLKDSDSLIALLKDQAPVKGSLVALRGGSWFDIPEHARCSFRLRDPPGGWYYDIGFRVILSLAKLETAS